MESASIEIVASTATNRGRKRASNQDSLLADFPVFIVADGMGGHSAGDLASQKIIQLFQPLTGRMDLSVAEVIQTVRAAQLQVSALADTTLDGAGSTLTGMFAVVNETGQHEWLVVNIGDSRTYRFFASRLIQLTHDHSEVQMLIDQGKLLPGDAKKYPRRNVISRAIGDGVSEGDYWTTPIVPSERLLICSDGLTSPVDEETILGILTDNVDSGEDAATGLVDAALAAGGPDNVSVIVIDVIGPATVVDGDMPDLTPLLPAAQKELPPTPMRDDTEPSRRAEEDPTHE